MNRRRSARIYHSQEGLRTGKRVFHASPNRAAEFRANRLKIALGYADTAGGHGCGDRGERRNRAFESVEQVSKNEAKYNRCPNA